MPKRTRKHQEWLIEKLSDPSRAESYLNTAFEDSTEMFLEALRDVAQAKQMSAVAKKAGLQREALYRALSKAGNPTIDTLVALFRVLRLKLVVKADILEPQSSSPSPRRSKKRTSQTSSKFHGTNASSGVQLLLDFGSSTTASLPAVQQSLRGPAVAVNTEVTQSQVPPYLASIFLERNYGYPRDFNIAAANKSQ